MKTPHLIRLFGPALAVATATLAVAPAAHAQGNDGSPLPGAAAVYTETNSATSNALEVFHRDPAGALSFAGSFATGGTGSGTGLGSGHSVVTSPSGRVVLAVNAGSDSVAAFEVGDHGLSRLGQPAPSGGSTPTSVTISGRFVYVLNAGSGTISGFRLDGTSGLHPIVGSTQPLFASGTGIDSQIQFDRTGHVLIVDERGVNKIQTFVVDPDGIARPGQTIDSTAGGPFGFDVDQAGHVLFSDTAIGTSSGASSYDVSESGILSQNGAPVASGQAAACWLAAVGGFAYTDNAASGSISTLSVASDGTLALTGNTSIASNAHPLDMAGTSDGHLYVLANGLNEIIGYQVAGDGSLTQVSEVAVPAGVIGLGAN